MKRKTCKCAWCGAELPLTKNGKRPAQHKNGKTTCVGSGQPIEVHNGRHTVSASAR